MNKHEIVSDIKRVAADLGRAPTRKEYVRDKLGKYSEHAITKVFETFSQALRASGFDSETKRPDTSYKQYEKQVHKYDLNQKLAKHFDQEITPYIGKYDQGDMKVMSVVVGSDFHSQWTDPYCLEVFIDTCKRIQPSVICLAGDVFDFYQVSAYSKNPRRAMTLQSEINFIKTHIFQPLREHCPESQIDLFIGNHEWRLFNFLCNQAPGLASLDAMQFDQLFELDKYRINLVARKSFLNAKKGQDFENYKVYGGSFVVTHGTAVGGNPALAELKKWGMSGASGHVHRYQTQTMRDLSGAKSWTSLGCMCALKSGEEYIPDLVRWTQGFLIAHIFDSKVVSEYIDLTQGVAVVGGVYYFKKEKSGKPSLA